MAHIQEDGIRMMYRQCVLPVRVTDATDWHCYSKATTRTLLAARRSDLTMQALALAIYHAGNRITCIQASLLALSRRYTGWARGKRCTMIRSQRPTFAIQTGQRPVFHAKAANTTAMWLPAAALFFTSCMFAANEAPPVLLRIDSNRKGVTCIAQCNQSSYTSLVNLK
eukprot:GHRR01027780.1.p1 GENE.GHRR01027780.1~~GHRR01027780.1.p1  ORF type:complete len:168 (+),score=13.24 GHRR01027780.1:200-703(+)